MCHEKIFMLALITSLQMSNSILLNAANGLKIVKIYETTNTVIKSWSIYIIAILMEKPVELSLRSGVLSMS